MQVAHDVGGSQALAAPGDAYEYDQLLEKLREAAQLNEIPEAAEVGICAAWSRLIRRAVKLP